jgi:hypothetical protein
MSKKRMTPPKDLGKALTQGYQPMFMTPGEVINHYHLGDANLMSREPGPKGAEQKAEDEETLQYKLKDSQHTQSYDGTSSLYDSIKRQGVHTPIFVGSSRYISRPVVTNGHHRLAAARHLNPNQFVPVEYN